VFLTARKADDKVITSLNTLRPVLTTAHTSICEHQRETSFFLASHNIDCDSTLDWECNVS